MGYPGPQPPHPHMCARLAGRPCPVPGSGAKGPCLWSHDQCVPDLCRGQLVRNGQRQRTPKGTASHLRAGNTVTSGTTWPSLNGASGSTRPPGASLGKPPPGSRLAGALSGPRSEPGRDLPEFLCRREPYAPFLPVFPHEATRIETVRARTPSFHRLNIAGPPREFGVAGKGAPVPVVPTRDVFTFDLLCCHDADPGHRCFGLVFIIGAGLATGRR